MVDGVLVLLLSVWPFPILTAAAVCANLVGLATATKASHTARRGPWKLLVLDRITGATTQKLEFLGEPAFDGLSLTRSGGVVVALRDGGAVAFGTGASP